MIDEATKRRRILFYCGGLITLLSLASPSGGLIGTPMIFFLKNKLHLQAHELAAFVAWASLPVYAAFALGFLRDKWNPFGRGDRGYLMLFGALTAILYAAVAFAPPTYWSLLVGMLFIATATLLVTSAQYGLTAGLAREHLMSGQVSAIWNLVVTVPGIAALLVGGALSDQLETQKPGAAIRILFLSGAVLMAAVAAIGTLKPRSVFPEAKAIAPPPSSLWADLKRLLRHRPIYAALIIQILWAFSPGGQTPLQFYFSNTLHLSDSQYGAYNAIFAVTLIPTYLLFAWLSLRYSLGRLLWWGTVIGVPGMVPLLFIHSPAEAMAMAVPVGLLYGVANAAFLDLVIRSCPDGLEGTVMMLTVSLTALSANLGDVLGAKLYDRWGDFVICVAAATATNAAILLVLPFVSKALIAKPDAKASEVSVGAA